MATATDTPWSSQERLGTFITVVAGIISLLATLSVLVYAGLRSAKRRVGAWRGIHPARPPDAMDSGLFLNLMFMDALQALAALPNTRWMLDAGITVGPLCTSQGVLKHIGGVGIATASLAIAAHTFSILVWDWKPRRHASAMILTAVWGFVMLNVIIPNGVQAHHGLYGPVGYWCWVKTEFKWIQLFNHYIWVWLDGFFMIILYTTMCWVMVRTSQQGGGGAAVDREVRAMARMLLYYPVLFVVCVFPNSLSRWFYYTGHHTSYKFTLFANALYTLSGALDVALFLITHKINT